MSDPEELAGTDDVVDCLVTLIEGATHPMLAVEAVESRGDASLVMRTSDGSLWSIQISRVDPSDDLEDEDEEDEVVWRCGDCAYHGCRDAFSPTDGRPDVPTCPECEKTNCFALAEGEEICRECGEVFSDEGGDGYDGLCPGCADAIHDEDEDAEDEADD